MDVTRRLTEHVLNTRYEDIPAHALDIQKHSLADAIGVMLAATTQCQACRPFLDYACESGDAPICTVYGTGKKASAVNAALVNGSLAHALDFEDSSSLATLHPNAVPTPALLALAEMSGGVSGKELLAALTIASDIAIRLSLACREDLSKYGWYMPPVFGSIAAVLAGSRLLGLSFEQTLDAVACSLFQATGSSELVNSGNSVMRSVRDGFGAKAAVLSVLLAKRDVKTRFDAPFEGKNGFFAAYTRGDCDLSVLLDGLGEKYLGENLTFKVWPSCHGTHCGIRAITELMRETGLRFADIESAHVVISEFCKNLLMEPRAIKNRPDNAINAKFSIPYTLGLAAKRGNVTLDDFTPSRLHDEEIYRFAEHVTYEVDENLKAKYQTNYTRLTLTTKKGVFTKYCEKAAGDPELPMTEENFGGKFMSCAGMSSKAYSPKELERLYHTLMHVEELDDVRAITALL